MRRPIAKRRVGLLLAAVTLVALPGAAVAAVGFLEPDVTVIRSHTGGPSASGLYGWVGADLGDLDGDGVPDYGITDIIDSTGGPLAGRAYVYSGADGSVLNTVEGVAGELLGYSLASAGDVNADGVPDYVVGAPGFAAIVPTPPGRAIVYSGADHSVLHEFAPDTITRMGTAVSGAGDVNGDGHADLIVGSQDAANGKNNGEQAGRVTVYSGADGSVVWSRGRQERLGPARLGRRHGGRRER